MWYQAGKSQADFDRDAQECALIAQDFARQATETGKSEDPAAYASANLHCLTAKGWGMSSSDAGRSLAPLGSPMAVVDGRSVRAFGSVLGLPEGFSLDSNHTASNGSTINQRLVFRNLGGTFVVVTAQRTVSQANRFESRPYLVEPPFFLYRQATAPSSGPQWAVFCGQINGEWVEGLGCYPLASAHERLIVIVTSPLPAQHSEPKARFRLSDGQFAAVEAFTGKWVHWLSAQVSTPPPSFFNRLKALGLFRR